MIESYVDFFDKSVNSINHELASSIRNEWVIQVEGIVKKRIENNIPSSLLGINIGPNKNTVNMTDDFLRCAEIFFPIGDYITINISSPNTAGLRDFDD